MKFLHQKSRKHKKSSKSIRNNCHLQRSQFTVSSRLQQTGSAGKFHSKAVKLKKKDCEKTSQKAKMADEKQSKAKSMKIKESQGSVISSVSSGSSEEKMSFTDLRARFSAAKTNVEKKSEVPKKKPASTISKPSTTGLYIYIFFFCFA